MIGLVLLLHFGLFDLLGLAWRAAGVRVEPIMRQPMSAKSLSDFWSRWNRGFRDLAFRQIFRPLQRRIGSAWATLATFAFSGVLHDLVISVPARTGFGLPTLYFLIQAAGVLFEKSSPGRRIHPVARCAMMYVVLIAPLGLLFHPPFVRRVFVPFLIAIGGAS
jgi:alginate O-acetyltransferase complex protein AlgI